MIKFLQNNYKYIIVYFFVLCLLILTTYNFYFSNKILPGVFIGGTNFGGLTHAEAVSKLNSLTKNYTEIKVNIEDIDYVIKSDEINLKFLNTKTADILFNEGRGDIFSHYKYLNGLFAKKYNGKLSYQIDENLLNKNLATISATFYPKVKNAYFTINNNILEIVEAGSGKNINLNNLKSSILKGIGDLKIIYKVTPTEFIPSLYKADLQEKYDIVNKLLKKKLTFRYNDNIYSPDNEVLLKFFEYTKNNTEVVAVENEREIKNYINTITSKVNREPKSINFKINEEGKITEFTPPVNGLIIDSEKAYNDTKNTLIKFINSQETELNTVELSVTVLLPNPNINKYGITELFAEGVSYFKGSIQNRIENIKVASERINGSLVAPGEIYSFNDAVGPIDVAHGFNSAYVISKGRTILGTGGGVCQVSTTLFRAALNAGFPITERVAHAYRVGYYEQNSEIGYDASIYQPTVDLKFKNDSEHYILVSTEVDLIESKLTVKLFGTKDGRQVEITKPTLGPQIAPPETIYEDDPTLQKGQLVQIEYSAWGGSSHFKQIVKDKNGVLKFENEFKSYYRPWPAVYKKGTKG